MSLPSTRAEAKAVGSKHYYPEAPCKHGHAGQRYTTNNTCVMCRRESKRRHYARNPKAQRDRHLVHKYGLSRDQVDEIIEAQEGECSICSRPFEGNWRAAKAPCVDHCHNSNAVRGILCNNCNRGLGYFSDDPRTLRAAATYIEKHNGRNLSKPPDDC